MHRKLTKMFKSIVRKKHEKHLADETTAEKDNCHVCKLNKLEVQAVSTSSETSFCTCYNAPKSTVSPERKTLPLTKLPLHTDVSLGCQTNLGKDITVELAVYHGDTKVVSENFEFPNATVTDKTVQPGKAFEIYCEIVNEEMLQVWGVEKKCDEMDDSKFRQSIHRCQTEHLTEKEQTWNNINWNRGGTKVHSLIYWAKSQTDKCRTAILGKYDEIWKMLDQVTVEALNELLAKERELLKLIEEVAEAEIAVTDYEKIIDK